MNERNVTCRREIKGSAYLPFLPLWLYMFVLLDNYATLVFKND